jgi:zeaxanthin glucosyltransferase
VSTVSRIFFWTWNEPGHVNPALALARRLRLRGHSVSFISGESVTSSITAHGFAVHRQPFDAYSGPISPYRTMTEVVGLVRGLGADLILCDAMKTVEVVISRAAGVRAAIYSPLLPIWRDRLCPSLYSPLSEPRSFVDRVHIRASWWVNGVRQSWRRRSIMRLAHGYRQANDFLRLNITPLALGGSNIEWNTNTGLPLPYFRNVPTLVMCPEGLDFRRADEDRLHWIDPCVLRERPNSTEMPEINEGGPLIFVSLGTQVHRVPWAAAWFDRICRVLHQQTHWQAVLAVGDVLAGPLSKWAVPGRITIAASAPQHLVLEKAAVAIVHGGINSLKECIMAAVPMALFPTGLDQVGNAVRARDRGLGLIGSPSDSDDKIRTLVETLLNAQLHRRAIEEMRTKWRRAEEADSGCVAVESLLNVRSLV